MENKNKKELGTAIGCLGILLIFSFLVKWMLPKDWDEDKRNGVSTLIILVLIIVMAIIGMFIED